MLAFLHTAAVHVETFQRLTTNADANVAQRHVVREDLLALALAAGAVTPDIAAAVQAEVAALVGQGARIVVCTCSTLGRCAEATPVAGGAEVLRVDRPLAAQVVESGQRVLVVAATPGAMQAAAALLREVATQQARGLRFEELLCDSAWGSFLSGDHAGYAQQIAELIERHAVPGDQVMLAQASMAPALPLIQRRDISVAASPAVGVQAALAHYRRLS